MARCKALLAVLAACLAVVSAQQCNVAAPGAPAEIYQPGLFDGGPAPFVATPNCPASLAPEPNSKYPFWVGTATAAYQVEGATTEGGRGVSIWDTFSAIPGKVYQNETGATADDFYHRFLQDIQLMKSLGFKTFRMSLSWPRLFPNGTGDLNEAGVTFYNNLIDALLANCITPQVTLYHWDLPQALEDEYGGWLSDRIVDDFAAYAEAAFELFGDRVKIWTTINEPATICNVGFGAGAMAPGRCSNRTTCPEGNSTTEPQVCAYHTLLAHAAAVPAFRRLVPDGKVSMNTNLAPFYMPLTDSPQDVNATETLNRLTSGQFLDPLFTGNWGAERLELYGPDIMPRFTPEQQQMLKAAKPDYAAINFYDGAYGYFDPNSTTLQSNSTINNSAGVPLPTADSPWLHVFPEAIRAMLNWVDKRYSHPTIIITENGVSVPGENNMTMPGVLCDTYRVDFYRNYFGNASAAVTQDGVDLQGYFPWSLMDNFEWADGYHIRFGIVYVDYATLRRYYKASALWIANQFGTSTAQTATDAVDNAFAQDVKQLEAAHPNSADNITGITSNGVEYAG